MNKSLFIALIILFTLTVGCAASIPTVFSSNLNADMAVGASLTVAEGIRKPDGLTIDDDGVLYFSCRYSNSIFRLPPGGEVELYVKLRCKGVIGLAVDADKNLFVAGTDKVFRVSEDKEVVVLAKGFKWAEMVALDSMGNLYIADARQNRVFRLSKVGNLSIYIENTLSRLSQNTWYVTGLLIDEAAGLIYTANYETGQVIKYPMLPSGQAGEPTVVVEMQRPTQMVMDIHGRLYVTTCERHKIIYVVEGSVDMVAGSAYPTAISFGRGALDSSSIFVANIGGTVSRIKVDTVGK